MWWDIVSKTKTISSVELVYSSFHYSSCFILYTIGYWRCNSKVVFYTCFVYFEVNVWYKMSCCKRNSYLCLMLTLFRCPLITENKHLSRDPELSSVTRNCLIYIIPLDNLNIGINKLKDFISCIKVKRIKLLNSLYSSVSLDSPFKETPYVNFFTDPELSSSLYTMTIYQTSTIIKSWPCLPWLFCWWHRSYVPTICKGMASPC